ncbi:MAG TPA: hypothetical protein VK177_09165 [Flavobacteriales bacterium]|nr:hypothetical protein [Flavobacteriales bacterium]
MNSQAQENPADLRVKGRQLLFRNQVDSAQAIFEYISEKYPDYDKATISSQLADIYFWYKNDSIKAEKKYLEVFATNGIYLLRHSCLELANIYIGKNNFKQALYYLQKAEKDYPHFFTCEAGEWIRKTKLAYQFAQCYAGTNKHDKAVKELTGYVFSDPAQFGHGQQDSLLYMEITRFYVSELKLFMNHEKLKAEWAKATQALIFEIEPYDNEQGKWVTVEGYFIFLGQKVILPTREDFFNEDGGKSYLEYYKRENLMKVFDDLPTYKALNTL